MNVIGLYVAYETSFAFAWSGDIRGCGTQGFAADSNFAMQFAKWVGREKLSQYDRIAVWTPRVFLPSIAPAYRWLIETHPDKFLAVSPKTVRTIYGLASPTRRAYVRAARKRHKFHVGRFEECAAIACCQAAYSTETPCRKAAAVFD